MTFCGLVGAPGSGKGTISNWIVRDFQLAHVSSGDLLRYFSCWKTIPSFLAWPLF
jgi:adenylate kinase family enzyme